VLAASKGSEPHEGPARSPWAIVLASMLGAGLALATALWLTRDAPPDVWYGSEHLALTPERAAESFIEAYRSGAFQRAARLSTGTLSRSLMERATRRAEPRADIAQHAFVVQESHRLDNQSLRLVGVLVPTAAEAEAEESVGKPVSLTLVRHGSRYVVREVQW